MGNDADLHFRRLLELLQMQIGRFHRDGHPDYELMLDIVSYLREYGDEVHHPREDVAFARLAQRRPDIQLVLARLAQEHRQAPTLTQIKSSPFGCTYRRAHTVNIVGNRNSGEEGWDRSIPR